jgi:hypothetical protein
VKKKAAAASITFVLISRFCEGKIALAKRSLADSFVIVSNMVGDAGL